MNSSNGFLHSNFHRFPGTLSIADKIWGNTISVIGYYLARFEKAAPLKTCKHPLNQVVRDSVKKEPPTLTQNWPFLGEPFQRILVKDLKCFRKKFRWFNNWCQQSGKIHLHLSEQVTKQDTQFWANKNRRVLR